MLLGGCLFFGLFSLQFACFLTTVIVAQLRTSNHSVFKTKCYTIENNGKKRSEKHSKTNKEGFSLP